MDCYWQARPVRGQKRPCFIVNVDGTDWERCDKFKQWNDRQRDNYTKGLINNPIRVGKLAEVACGVMLNQEPDFAFRHGGDNQDFVVGGLSIDVKATVTSNVQCLLMVKSTVNATAKWVEKDIFIVCRVFEFDHMASIQVVGFFTTADVSKLPDVPSTRDRHMNKELRFVESRQLPELIDLLRGHGANVVGMDDARWVGEKYGFEKIAA